MLIKLEKIKENKRDNTVTFYYEVDEEAKRLIKEYYKVKKWSNKLFERFIKDICKRKGGLKWNRY